MVDTEARGSLRTGQWPLQGDRFISAPPGSDRSRKILEGAKIPVQKGLMGRCLRQSDPKAAETRRRGVERVGVTGLSFCGRGHPSRGATTISTAEIPFCRFLRVALRRFGSLGTFYKRTYETTNGAVCNWRACGVKPTGSVRPDPVGLVTQQGIPPS